MQARVTAFLFFAAMALAWTAHSGAQGEFSQPRPVAITGYQGHAMEPFITRDGRYLLFNNLNDPSENTDLHWAERVSDEEFRYRGKITGTNTKALEGVPTVDRSGNLYFVSTRSYEQTLSTIYRGRFDKGVVAGVSHAQNRRFVSGTARRQAVSAIAGRQRCIRQPEHIRSRIRAGAVTGRPRDLLHPHDQESVWSKPYN